MWRAVRGRFIPRGLPRFERRADLLFEAVLTLWPFLLGLAMSLTMMLSYVGPAELREAPATVGLLLSVPLSVVRERMPSEWARKHPGRRYRR